MVNDNLLHVNVDRHGRLTRRSLLTLAAGGWGALTAGSFLRTLGLNAAEMKKEGRACIMVFLNGAPSQLETWDPKPNTENGGPTKAIQTAIPGVQFAEYWPKLAKAMQDLSVIRTIAGKEAAHERGQYHLRTGHRLIGATKFPHLGAVVAQRLGDPDSDIPNFVSIGNTIGSGFLGVNVSPFIVTAAGRLPDNVSNPVTGSRAERRLELLRQQDEVLSKAGAPAIAQEHQELYRKATRLMASSRMKAFTLDGESDAVKQSYGANAFGQGCLVARRLVESGVPFIEVQRGGWDMHQNLWQSIPKTAAEVDQGVSALIDDLKKRGMLDKTLVVCIGEFGRTPAINQRTPEVGRDHWAKNFNCLIAGSGIRGGVCIGTTSDDGMEIADRPVEVEELFQSLFKSLGINADEEIWTPDGRPVKLIDGGSPVPELFA